MEKIETVDDAINYIHSRHKWSKTPSFKRLDALLDALDNPQKANQYIHVTGTNGKGSTSKMLTQILRTAGLKVGLFTSPYIEKFNERIQDNAGTISDKHLLAAVQQVAPITERLDQELTDGGPTEFETLTATMFVYFRSFPVDVVVLEVGVGGTWDSTEVIPDKLVSIITNVGYDHMRVLGNTLGEIARAKAGIIQEQRPVIIGPLDQEAEQVIRQVALDKAAPVLAYGKDFTTINHTDRQLIGEHFDFVGAINISNIELALTGNYQQVNASLAIQAALQVAPALNVDITPVQIRKALATVEWPARFEVIAKNPLTIIDGAHNPQGVQALKQTLLTRFSKRKQSFHLIVGVLADKHFSEMLTDLASIPGVQVHVVHFQAPNQRTDVSKENLLHTKNLSKFDYSADWYSLYQELRKENEPIVFTGSLYFVSEVREKLMHSNR